MRCATPATLYAYPSGSGGSLVAFDTLTLGGDVLECSGSSFVVLSQAEYVGVAASPFRLNLDEAAAIGGSVLLVWAAGFAVRVLVQTLRDTDRGDGSES